MPTIPLPRGWTKTVRSAVLQVMALAHYAIVSARGRAVLTSPILTEVDRLRQEVFQLQEESRFKDSRLSQIPSAKRPHYQPAERMAILELKAIRGWSLAQTAERFLVSPQTISSWLQRLDEMGPEALIRLSEPINKFPHFVGYIVRRLRILCPSLGK